MWDYIKWGDCAGGLIADRGGLMLRFHSPFEGKRLTGDRKKMIFHDSHYESRPGPLSGCQIDRIICSSCSPRIAVPFALARASNIFSKMT
jgi:hypothetical protein